MGSELRTINDVVKAVDGVVKAKKTSDAELAEIRKSLADGKGNADVIDLGLKRLELAEKAIARRIQAARVVRGQLRELEMDEAFLAANGKKLSPLVGLASTALKAMTDEFAKVKKDENDAEAALKAASSVTDRARQRLAGLVVDVDGDKKNLKALFGKADALYERATIAADARDTAGLRKAKDAFDALGVGIELTLHRDIAKRIDDFAKEATDKSLAAIGAELKDGVADLRIDMKSAGVYAEQLQKAIDGVKGLAATPIDVAKAAKSLSIDRAGEAALAAALKLPLREMEVRLNALGAKQKPKTTGKAMIEKLGKDGLM